MTVASTLLSAATLFTFASSVTATASTPGVVGFEFTKSKVLARDFPHLARRQSGTVQAALENALVLYAINVCLASVPPWMVIIQTQALFFTCLSTSVALERPLHFMLMGYG